jgi:Tfp pilus assembly protein PilN
MKEIDLLPEWYKTSRKRYSRFYAQYAAVGLIFTIMAGWSIFAGGSVRKAEAELVQLELQKAAIENEVKEYSELSGQVEQLRQKAVLIQKVDSRIDLPSVLAEMSFLIDEKILINKLSLTAEKIDKIKGKKTTSENRMIQFSQTGQESLLGNVRFVVTMSGVAADASEVANLICRLEDSPYFCQVVPLYTEEKKTKDGNVFTGDQLHDTEFAIGCYIDNYRE